LIGALSVAGITLIGYLWLHFNSTTIALVLLLGVLAISAVWGLSEAVFMSVTATVALDYFFLPPIGTLTITDPHNWVALVTFLVTAIAVSELSARARREARSAVERRRELSVFTPSASYCSRATARPSC
jgi:two-component system sensor histidine kinase KdpD